MANNTQRNIIIDIETKTNKATQDIKRLNKEIDRLGKQNKNLAKTNAQVDRMSRGFVSLGKHLARIAILYGSFQGLTNVVKTFADFEQSIKRLGIVSGATAEDLNALEQKAKDLGESTIYTASQVADGMNALAMAGLTAKQSLDSIGTVLNVATIGMISLEEASLITVRAISAFGLASEDAARVGDVLAIGATNSAQTVTELGQAFQKVGSVAHAYGVSIEETTVALELMANAGRRGSEAGTQLKIVLSRLAGNKEARKYIEELGISMYDAKGQLLPFKEQLILLQGELSKLSAEEQNIKLGQIVGEEGKASMLILLNGLDEFDTKLEQLRNSFGVSSEQAMEMQNTLLGSYRELKSALEGLSIKIATELSPALRQLLTDTTRFVQALDPNEVAKFGRSIGDLIGVISDFAIGVGSVISTLSEMAGTFESMTDISLAWVVAIVAIGAKLRSVSLALSASLAPALAVSAPAVAVLTVAFIGAGLAIAEMEKDMALLDARIHGESLAFEKLASTMEQYRKGGTYANLTIVETTTALNQFTAGLALSKYELTATQNAIDDYESRLQNLSKAEKYQYEALKLTRDNLTRTIIKYEEQIVAVKAHGNALNDLTEAGRKSALELANNEEALQKLTKAEEDLVAKQKKRLEDRVVSGEKALGVMYDKERKYAYAIAKLEQDLSVVHEKYADYRLSLEQDLEQRLFTVQTKGLNSYTLYLKSQERASEQLALAKGAISKGEIEVAKKYLDEYDKLIAVSAGEEIVVNDRVFKRKNETVATFAKQDKAGHLARMDILNIEEKKEADAVIKKIDAQKTERELNLAQIGLQKEMLVLLSKLVEQATGIKITTDFTEFEQALTKGENDIQAMTDKQRMIKIDGDLSELDTKVKDFGKDTEFVLDTNLNTKPAEITMIGFKKDAENDGILKPMDIDTTKALQTDKEATVYMSTMLYKPMDLNATKAIANEKLLMTVLQRGAVKYVDVYYRYHNGGGAYQNGGEVQQMPLPRFAVGGDLDSGIGHTRKSGKLGGYGGGDKIKALLEKGEFIIRKEAVKSLGIKRLETINQGRLPRFASGGQVTPTIPTGLAQSNNAKANQQVDLNFNIGGQQFKTTSDAEVANALAEYLQRHEF